MYKITSYRNGVYGICLMSQEENIRPEEQKLFDSVYPIKDLNGLSYALLDNNEQDSIFILVCILTILYMYIVKIYILSMCKYFELC